MNFESALKAMREGKKIKRNSWSYKRFIYIDNYLNDICSQNKSPIGWHSYHTSNNILAEDWEIVDE